MFKSSRGGKFTLEYWEKCTFHYSVGGHASPRIVLLRPRANGPFWVWHDFNPGQVGKWFLNHCAGHAVVEPEGEEREKAAAAAGTRASSAKIGRWIGTSLREQLGGGGEKE